MISPCPCMTPILAVLVSTLTLAAGHNVSHGQCNLDGLCLGDLVDETSFNFETEAEKRAACITFCRKTPKCFWYSLAPYSGLCLALRDCPTLDKSMTKPFSFYSGNKDCSKYLSSVNRHRSHSCRCQQNLSSCCFSEGSSSLAAQRICS